MWEGGEYPCERVFVFLFVFLEAEVSLRAMMPTSSDAKLVVEVGRDRVDRCILPCQRPFVDC